MNIATHWTRRTFQLGVLATALWSAMPAFAAFVSGSTGADGPFSPTVNTVVQLPANGVLNYTSVNIPTGVNVTFQKNATNTPVVMLVQNDVTIAGTLSLNGTRSADVGAAGTGNIGDDGLPGDGGPGGYGGGAGGRVGADRNGGTGKGPGGGTSGFIYIAGGNSPWGGGDASHATSGAGYQQAGNNLTNYSVPTYGSSTLLPLIGGSGGGGGAGGTSFSGAGGGGGGGAILIAASGTVNVTGTINASGDVAGAITGSGIGAAGGSGSGGAIRIVATTITGNGIIRACYNPAVACSTQGSVGRIRLESETYTRTAASNPVHSFGAPGQVFIAGAPSLTITSVAGTNAPAAPTGNADITLPASTVNPVTVTFASTGIPVGNTVKLTVTPAYGVPVTAISPAISGTTASGAASVSVSLPAGPSTLLAQTSYTITVAMGAALSYFAQGEQVERIAVSAVPGQPARYSLVTVSGKEFDVPLARLAGII